MLRDTPSSMLEGSTLRCQVLAPVSALGPCGARNLSWVSHMQGKSCELSLSPYQDYLKANISEHNHIYWLILCKVLKLSWLSKESMLISKLLFGQNYILPIISFCWWRKGLFFRWIKYGETIKWISHLCIKQEQQYIIGESSLVLKSLNVSVCLSVLILN